MSVDPILEAKNLAFERNENPVFSPVSLLLSSGEALHIEGPNGCGKTTLFQLLVGLLQPSQGSIAYCGQPLSESRYDYLDNVIYIGHQSAVKGMLTAEENLRWLSPAGINCDELAQALQLVGLQSYAHVLCHQLSAGQQRRVALARLVTTQAKLWYLDEPFAALDKQGVELVENLMDSHLQNGGAVMFSSHQDLAKITTRKYSMMRAGPCND